MSWERNYLELCKRVIDTGYRAESRAGATRSLPGCMLKIPLDQGFPLLTTRRMHPDGVIGELAGFVRGAEDLATYEKFGCKYWRDNAAEWVPNRDKPFEEWQIGRSYGAIWRSLSNVDQLANVIAMLKTDPLSRRHVVSAWDPGAQACLPSCHIMFQFYVRDGGLHCGVYMRSVDLCVGLPSDIVLYALLTSLVAKDVGLQPKSLTFFLLDTHVYENHVALFSEQYSLVPGRSPQMAISPGATTLSFTPDMISISGYDPTPPIKYLFNK